VSSGRLVWFLLQSLGRSGDTGQLRAAAARLLLVVLPPEHLDKQLHLSDAQEQLLLMEVRRCGVSGLKLFAVGGRGMTTQLLCDGVKSLLSDVKPAFPAQ
jgi:hypothetical protein